MLKLILINSMLLAQPLQDKIRDTLYLLPQIQIGLLVIRFSSVSDNRSLVLYGTTLK